MTGNDPRRLPGWLVGLGKALLYGFVSAIVLLALAIALSGPSQRERKETARNVAKLVGESRKNRQLLCAALIRDQNSQLANDPDVLRLCSQVGIKPQARAETPVPSLSAAPQPSQPSPAPSVPGPSPTAVSVAPTPSFIPTPSIPCIPILTCGAHG